LAQRITARYHLLPLNPNDLAAYIKHRLSVADCHRDLFNKGALVAIHQLSQGIPRLINLICHSALMEAYNSNNAVIDKKIVLKAASHALGDDFQQSFWWQKKRAKVALAASTLVVVLLSGFWLGKKDQPLILSSPITESPSSVDVFTDKSDLQESQNAMPQEPQKLTSKPRLAEPENINVLSHQPTEQLVISGDKKAPLQENTTKSVENKIDTIPLQLEESHVKSIDPNDDYKVEAVDGVSDDLLMRFQTAIDDTKNVLVKEKNSQHVETINSDVKPITQMPSWVQEGVPSLSFSQHIYASDGEGWVNVNGRNRYEGDSIANDLVIDKILPQHIILIYRGETFSFPALTNW
jgi:hypothetical protein